MAQGYCPPGASEMMSPFAMPPSQYNTIPQDLSSHLARSQALRRPSTHSSSASNSSKRCAARVTKLRSAENSPHNVQRRRTTAAHTTRDYSRTPQDNPNLTREQRLWNYYNSRKALLEARPFSWHPGSVPVPTPEAPLPTSEPAMGHAISGLENLAVSETPPSVQQSIQDAFSMGYGYPITSSSASLGQHIAASQSLYQATGQDHYSTLPPYSSHDFSEPSQDYCVGHVSAYQAQTYPTYQWSQRGLSDLSAPDNPYDPVNLPQVQPMPTKLHCLQSKELPDIPKEEGDELVGIGLYDDEDGDYVSTMNSGASSNPIRTSLGKDLKLEETWQLPNKDDEEAGNSSDEPEEAEEEVPVVGPSHAEIQTAFYPTYGDLSNQSFFFNDDVDSYTADDQYTNYLALNPTLQPGQVKTQPTGSGNFLWI
ncbi:MAG: hypothetical protein Q9217_005733 [Psora testacea]